MKAEIEAVVRGADLAGWEPVEVEYGSRSFPVLLPGGSRVLEMNEVAPLLDPAARMRACLEAPIGSRPLPAILLGKGKPVANLTVCITTSDITRPVPYKGDSGILRPLLAILHGAGISRENVTLVVGTGTHRPSTPAEKVAMFGEEVAAGYRIVDHSCDDPTLVDIGRTASGTPILINRTFYEVDLKIATALVESHFMAGASGGRKAVCPALVSRRTIERFHSAQFLDSPLAANLVLEGNPCHEEALEIALKCGVDFIVNTVLNRRLQLLDVFAGDLVQAHAKAVELLRGIVAIPLDDEYDVVLSHGGYVGINHYQIAKAAVNALPVVRPGGTIILAACERDDDPIGPLTYRTLLHLLKLQGSGGYMSTLLNPGWTFTKDQWEPQMWAKVLDKVGEEGLVYCSAVLTPKDHQIVPGRAGWDYLPGDSPDDEMAKAQAMVQNAIVHAVKGPGQKAAAPRVAFIKEGPYAVPVREKAAVTREAALPAYR